MPLRTCITPGCPNLTARTRCTQHEAEYQRTRNASRPGHRQAHTQARTTWTQQVAGGTIPCARCKAPITQGQQWDIDHQPDGTWWPAHATCNRAAH